MTENINFYEALKLNERFEISTTYVHPKSDDRKVEVITYPVGEMKNRFLWPLPQLLGTWAVDQESFKRECLN